MVALSGLFLCKDLCDARLAAVPVGTQQAVDLFFQRLVSRIGEVDLGAVGGGVENGAPAADLSVRRRADESVPGQEQVGRHQLPDGRLSVVAGNDDGGILQDACGLEGSQGLAEHHFRLQIGVAVDLLAVYAVGMAGVVHHRQVFKDDLRLVPTDSGECRSMGDKAEVGLSKSC